MCTCLPALTTINQAHLHRREPMYALESTLKPVCGSFFYRFSRSYFPAADFFGGTVKKIQILVRRVGTQVGTEDKTATGSTATCRGCCGYGRRKKPRRSTSAKNTRAGAVGYRTTKVGGDVASPLRQDPRPRGRKATKKSMQKRRQLHSPWLTEGPNSTPPFRCDKDKGTSGNPCSTGRRVATTPVTDLNKQNKKSVNSVQSTRASTRRSRK